MNIKDIKTIKNILLSYPRSGRGWLAYIISLILDGGAIDGFQDPHDAALTVTHLDADVSSVLAFSRNIPLVLLLRNYKECILRHKQKAPDGGCQQGNYWNNIVTFDAYPGRKIVLYYEDLINNPRDTVERLVLFFNDDISTADIFFENYEEYRQKSLNKYGDSHTKGSAEKLLWHSREMSMGDKKSWDKELMKRDIDLFNKYLKRYIETVGHDC